MVESPQRIWIEADDECPYFYEAHELHDVEQDVIEYVRADLYAALEAKLAARTGGVKVKPLEWEDADEGMCTKWRAAALGGHYELVALDGDVGGLAVNFHWGRPLSFWFIQGEPDECVPTGPKMFPTLEAAKDAAQADYERRILSALEATPPAPEGRQDDKPRAYIVHAPEDDYYGTGPDKLQFHPLAQHDLDAGYSQTPLFAHPPAQAGVGVNEDALRALAQAYDREDAAQRGEPDPWNLDDPGDIGDSDTWVSERLACARAAAEAFLSVSVYDYSLDQERSRAEAAEAKLAAPSWRTGAMGRVEIIERLAEGPSYALDVAIAQTFVPQIVVGRQRDDDSGADPHTYRCFTTKLDDAIWLAETLCPGIWWHVAKGKLTEAEPLYGAQLLFGAEEVIGEGEADTTPAIAILIALLKALEQKQ